MVNAIQVKSWVEGLTVEELFNPDVIAAAEADFSVDGEGGEWYWDGDPAVLLDDARRAWRRRMENHIRHDLAACGRAASAVEYNNGGLNPTVVAQAIETASCITGKPNERANGGLFAGSHTCGGRCPNTSRESEEWRYTSSKLEEVYEYGREDGRKEIIDQVIASDPIIADAWFAALEADYCESEDSRHLPSHCNQCTANAQAAAWEACNHDAAITALVMRLVNF